MRLQLERAWIDDLLVHDVAATALPYALRSASLSREAKADRSPRSGYHGGRARSRFLEAATLAVAGYASGITPAAADDAYAALEQRLRLTGELHTFRFRRLGAAADEEVCFELDAVDAPADGYGGSIVRWAATLHLPDPRVFSTTLRSGRYDPTAAGIGSGVRFPLGFPMTFEGEASPTLLVTNLGSLPTPVALRVRGPVVNPIIDLETTGESIYTTGLQLVGAARLPLTVSGNEITDAVRAARVQGDGRAADSSFGVWESATNRIPNGGFENGITGWTSDGTVARSHESAAAAFGSFGMRCTRSGSTGDGYVYPAPAIAVAAGEKVSASVSWRAPAGRTIRVEFLWRDGAGASLPTTTVTVGTGDGVQRRYAATATAPATAASVLVVFRVFAMAAGEFFDIDGAQLEPGPPTPYVDTNGAAATRAAARVRAPASLIDRTQGWVAMRVRFGWDNTNEPATFRTLFDWRIDANNSISLRYSVVDNRFEFDRRDGGGANQLTLAEAITLGEEMTIVAAWESGRLRLSINGGAFTNAAAARIPAGAVPALFDIASLAGGSQFNGDVLWFGSGTGTLTDADAAAIHAFGADDRYPEEWPGAPTLVWHAETADAFDPRAASDDLEIDTADSSAAIADVSRPDVIDAGLTRWFELPPGESRLRLRGTGMVAGQTELLATWRDAK